MVCRFCSGHGDWWKQSATDSTRDGKDHSFTTHLPSRSFLHLEKVIQAALLDRLQKRRGDVHVRIQTVLARCQLGKRGDGSLQMSGIAREVASDGAEVVRNRP